MDLFLAAAKVSLTALYLQKGHYIITEYSVEFGNQAAKPRALIHTMN